MELLEYFRVTDNVVDLDIKIENEVNVYLHLEVSGGDENPLEFWKGQRLNLPVSCSVESIVPVDAMFSTSGLILNQKRSSMAPHQANLLIHNNYAKFFPITREQEQAPASASLSTHSAAVMTD